MLKFNACILTLLTSTAMAQAPAPDFYQVNIRSNNVKFRCILNGLPVYDAADTLDATVSFPVQLYLVGKNNKLEIQAEAIDKSKNGTIEAQVVPYHQGDMINSRTQVEGAPTLTLETDDDEGVDVRQRAVRLLRHLDEGRSGE